MNDPGREHSRNSPKDHDNFSLSNSTSKRSRPVHAIRRVGHIKLAPIIYRPTCTRWITWSVLRQPPSLPKVVYSWYPFKAGSTWEPWSTLLFLPAAYVQYDPVVTSWAAVKHPYFVIGPIGIRRIMWSLSGWHTGVQRLVVARANSLNLMDALGQFLDLNALLFSFNTNFLLDTHHR